MSIIDTIINLFPTKKIRYQNQFDKVVNLTLPDYVNTSGNTNLAGGGKGTGQNPTGTGGSQGTNVGIDGLTAAEKLKKRQLENYRVLFAKYQLKLTEHNSKFVDGTTSVAAMAILVKEIKKLRAEVATALLNIKQFSEYTAAKTNFEAAQIRMGVYKVKTVV